jgi:hypothetical protein
MSSLPVELPIVAWECGECASTVRALGNTPCPDCGAENPPRYEILAASAPAATANTTYVDRRDQHKIVQAASRPLAAVAPRPIYDRVCLVERLLGTMVDIVGIEHGSRGRQCHEHTTYCGIQLVPGSKVRLRKETIIFNGTEVVEEDAVAAYVVGNGTMTCKVGFLPRHLALHRANDYDGLYARVVEIYNGRCVNITKRQKAHRNHGCCRAKILGDKPVFSL